MTVIKRHVEKKVADKLASEDLGGAIPLAIKEMYNKQYVGLPKETTRAGVSGSAPHLTWEYSGSRAHDEKDSSRYNPLVR